MHDLPKYIDQTLLCQDATEKEVAGFCEEALEYGFYAVCVQPCRVLTAARILRGSNMKIAAVVGFPCGSTFPEIKLREAEKCIDSGAGEIDVVMNIGALKDGNTGAVKDEIRKIKALPAVLKVIIETGLLTREEKLLACKLSAEAGADFVKTSTGFTKNSKPATIEDVKLMYDAVNRLGVKVKASGGIKDQKTAIAMINAGAGRIGTSSGVEIIGISSEKYSPGY